MGDALDLPVGSVAHRAFSSYIETDDYVRKINLNIRKHGGFGEVHRAQLVKSNRALVDVAVKQARGRWEEAVSKVSARIPGLACN